MKTFASLFAAFAVLPGILSPALALPNDPLLIVPGKSIGKMALGPNGTEVLKRFGKPAIQDGGMSQTTQVWLGQENRKAALSIHTILNGAIDAKPQEGVTIDEVRTSSSSFHTASGIAVGSTLRQIQHSFPQARRDQESESVVLYVDSRHGIAFEFSNDKPSTRCISITIMTPGDKNIYSGEEVSSLIKEYAPKQKR